ncbi:MAG: ECF transporter S component [Bacteroidetes bacterium]|nr:ECF transporter S component [Bacteroidota bacterium]
MDTRYHSADVRHYDPITDDRASVRLLPLAAMFTALGVLFPQLFHMLGLGSTFLPMFLPVLAAAMLLPQRLALIVGILTPLASWMLTGMPPLSPPILPLMVIELTAVALVAGTLRRGLRWPAIVVVSVAMAADRLLLLLIIEGVSAVAGIRHPLLGPAAVLAGLPGVAMAIIVLPPTVALIESRFPRLAAARAERSIARRRED